MTIRSIAARGARWFGLVGAVLLFACSSSGPAPMVSPSMEAGAGHTPEAGGSDAGSGDESAAVPAPGSDASLPPDGNIGPSSEAAAPGEVDAAEPADAPANGASDSAPANGTSDSAPATDGPVFTGMAKIMVVGSSNESGTCWRAFLWQKMHMAGMNFSFVGGDVVGPVCPGVATYEKNCQASPGTIVTGIPTATFHSWFMANPPDIVLQHIGGADLMQGITPAKVIMAYTTIVQQARLVNPKVIFLVGFHIPDKGCANCMADVMALNAAIPPWAAQITTAESPVQFVDIYTGLDLTTDFNADGVHLNNMGSEVVSDRFLAALTPILKH
jgi:hypothetical protein